MTEELNKPTFIINLDTELIWGYVAYSPHKDMDLLKRDSKKVRGCIDILLNLFQKHNIPATWAIVGHLFLENCECEGGVPHKDIPRFREDWYSSDPCTDIQRDPLYYGRDIVENILSNRIEHEIGYHSFSHVIFSECSRGVAEAERSKPKIFNSKVQIRLSIWSSSLEFTIISKRLAKDLESFLALVEKKRGEGKIEYREERPGDFEGKIVSTEKAKREHGWEPKVDFEEGVRRYIDWYKENIPAK